jgi:arginine-tRNA-protein transferase
MESLFRYVASPSPCGYLPDREWSMEYEYVRSLSRGEYLQRLLENWRRFGGMLFRPVCQSCTACRSLRVDAGRFRPDRSQRRARQANDGEIELHVSKPGVTRAKLDLYDRYHSFQADLKGWPEHPAKDAASYAESFVHHPFAVEEWCYYLDQRLVGVGYVDCLPDGGTGAGGLSAIYFFYDPRERRRSLGTYNVLRLIEEAQKRQLPYIYLGYFVEGSASMSYKANFVPNQLRGSDGAWRDFRTVSYTVR